MGDVLCCNCANLMQPNAANMCANCLQSEVDIQKHFNPIHCPDCDSYLCPHTTWIKAPLKSKEFMKECVERFKKDNKVSLIFIRTDPHRMEVKFRFQIEASNGAMLKEACIVEEQMSGSCSNGAMLKEACIVEEQMSGSCSRVQANPNPRVVVVVQVRQHVSHTTTFFYLEQLILKHDAAKDAIKIKQMNQGIDFFFNNWSHGEKFAKFLRLVTPTKKTDAKQLVSQDRNCDNNFCEYIISVEISPICRDDLVCLPYGVALSLGNLGRLVICSKVSDKIVLLDPFTLRQGFLSADKISFKALLSCKQLVKYVVLHVEEPLSEANVGGQKYVLVDVHIARISDFGENDRIFKVKTHLGHLLTPGSYVLGYDLHGANYNDIELDKHDGLDLQEVILIKKCYEEKNLKRGKPLSRKLKCLDVEIDNDVKVKDDENSEYELFLRDLEENSRSVFNLSLDSNGEIQQSETASTILCEDVSLVHEFEDLDFSYAEDHVDVMEE